MIRKGPRLQVGEHRYDLTRYKRLFAIGAGKARLAWRSPWNNARHAVERRRGGYNMTRGIDLMIDVQEAGHPVPDLKGQQATEQILALLDRFTADDLVFVLLSGVHRAFACSAPGVALADKHARRRCCYTAARRSLRSIPSANISAMKGGRMAAATRAHLITLILSDVLGDDLATIGSGPTALMGPRMPMRFRILRRYGIWNKVPPNVRAHLLKGRRGAYPESPKPGARMFRRVQNQIIGNNQAAVDTVARVAKQCGLHPLILSTSLQGEAREVAKCFGAMAREIVTTGRPIRRPACLIAGGEVTVTVRGRRGGAQESALAAAMKSPDCRMCGSPALGRMGRMDRLMRQGRL